VGIGTRVPLQRFHVQGTQFISERLGIGTYQPAANLHVQERYASIPSLIVENYSGGNLVEGYANSSNVFTILGSRPAMGIGTNLIKLHNTLEVIGNSEVVGNITCCNVQMSERITCANLTLSDSLDTYFSTQDLVQPDTTIQRTGVSYMPFIFNEGISTDSITSVQNDFVRFKNCGARIDGDFVVGNQMYVLSDARVKRDQKYIENPLGKIDRMRGYTYTLPSGKVQAGVIAQEVLEVLPEAVTMLPENSYAVSYDALVPLLLEAVRSLNAEVRQLKSAQTIRSGKLSLSKN